MARAGKPRILPPQIWALVAKELDAGSTYEQVHAELLEDGYEISVSTLTRYRREDAKRLRAQGKGPQPVPVDATLDRLRKRAATRDEPATSAQPLPEGAQLEPLLRRLLTDTSERLERARALGDGVVAAREAKGMAELTAQLARAQKESAASRDVMTFSRADIEQGMRTVREKVGAIVLRQAAQGGLMCAGCARQLAAALTGVSLEPSVAPH